MKEPKERLSWPQEKLRERINPYHVLRGLEPTARRCCQGKLRNFSSLKMYRQALDNCGLRTTGINT